MCEVVVLFQLSNVRACAIRQLKHRLDILKDRTSLTSYFYTHYTYIYNYELIKLVVMPGIGSISTNKAK
jgi:hypothetical protein